VSEHETRKLPRPPRFLADEHLDSDIVRGARRKRPGIVFLTAAEAGTRTMSDPELLERARVLDVILISHDRSTMYDYFADLLMRLPEGEHSPGVFLITQKRYSIGQIIEFIVELFDLSNHEEWRDQIGNLPL
jgi:hypothetical protein